LDHGDETNKSAPRKDASQAEKGRPVGYIDFIATAAGDSCDLQRRHGEFVDLGRVRDKRE
jgi:hypothetical protein